MVYLQQEKSSTLSGYWIIALTVFDDDSSIIDMLEAGASGYLLKNSDKHEIVHSIYTVQKGGSYYCRNMSNQLTCLIKNKSGLQKIAQPSLSDLELKIIRLLCEDKTSKEIAQEVYLSNRTVDAWRSRIQEKLKVPRYVRHYRTCNKIRHI